VNSTPPIGDFARATHLSLRMLAPDLETRLARTQEAPTSLRELLGHLQASVPMDDRYLAARLSAQDINPAERE
jgi:hypothetical protein